MSARVNTQREADNPAPEIDPRRSQLKRPETGRYLLQVDRQTKASYATAESAEAAGVAIKTAYPLVQVGIYDSVECRNTLVKLPSEPQ